MVNLRAAGFFAIAFAAGMFVTAFCKWPPTQSSDWASWVQAVGSIGAIVGSFYLGSRQAQWQAREQDRRTRAKYLSIAEAAMGYVDVISDCCRPDSGGILLAGVEAQRLLEVTATMESIALHEIGSADTIVAWSVFMKNLRWMNRTYEKVTATNDPIADAYRGADLEASRRRALQNVVNHTGKSFKDLRTSMVAEDN
jgi:hypothetical protein